VICTDKSMVEQTFTWSICVSLFCIFPCNCTVLYRESWTDTAKLFLLPEPEWYIPCGWHWWHQRIWSYYGRHWFVFEILKPLFQNILVEVIVVQLISCLSGSLCWSGQLHPAVRIIWLLIALAREIIQSLPSVCLSLHPFVSTLFSKPTDHWPWLAGDWRSKSKLWVRLMWSVWPGWWQFF